MTNCPYVKNHTGQRFGRLVAIKRVENNKYGDAMWLCQCDCGKQTVVKGSSLRRGNTRSCGCYHDDAAAERMRKIATKHGLSEHPLHHVHQAMIERCEKPNTKCFKNYGERGIKVCEEWHDYPTFYAWCMSNGYKQGLHIDRIDNNGNYEPGNCRFVTALDNANNTRKCRKVKQTNLNTGEVVYYRSINEAARMTGIQVKALTREVNGTRRKVSGYKFEEVI